MNLAARIQEQFGARARPSARMDGFVGRCARIYRGAPEWLDEEQGIRTVSFAKSVCSEAARLTTLAIGVKVDGSARAAWLQEQIDRRYFHLRHWVEYACAYGTVILKPNGTGVDLVRPDRFVITECDGDEIRGAVFLDRAYDGKRGKYYTRLEYHRFEDGVYRVSNRCFVGESERDMGRPAAIERTPWRELAEETQAQDVERPLFGVLRMPGANSVDEDSPLGAPFFADAIEELRDLDVAYSRFTEEIYDSRRIGLLDDRLTAQAGAPLNGPRRVRMPRFVRNVFGAGAQEFYREINPTLNTEARLRGVNALLDQIGYKCGFSNGYFVFNEKSGTVTATQVEADDRRTIQLVKDLRDKLASALDGLLYALNAFADAYALAPAGTWEATYDFGDITYNREEDRARWWGYVTQGQAPAWMYFVKFEGMSEQEAKAMAAEAGSGESVPFGDEE